VLLFYIQFQMIEVRRISAEDTYKIRLEVLRKNINLPYKFNGDLEDNTFHLGVFKDDKIIAVSSFMKSSHVELDGDQYQLRGMATLKEFQGYGAGKLMMQRAFSILSELNIDYLWCNARVVAVNFYEKQGLDILGDDFDIPLVGKHFVMFKKIS